MTKIVQKKYKISRRLGVNLWGRAKDPIQTRNYPPGVHGATFGYRKKSDFGLQLFAKQQLKGYYAMTEKQFRKVYEKAAAMKGDTSENLVGQLERRLDMAVFRLNFAPTIFAAQQLVSHNHIKVNGKKVNIKSYLLNPGDEISVGEKSQEHQQVAQAIQDQEREIPGYFECDTAKFTGKFISVPTFADIPYAAQMSPNLVIEYYSR